MQLSCAVLRRIMRLHTTTGVMALLVMLSRLVITSGDQYPTGTAAKENCTVVEAELQAALFTTVNAKNHWSNCPSQLWMDVYHRLKPVASNTFIDIGCNKGYTSAKIFERWAPHMMLTAEHVFEITKDCGACNDCQRSARNDAEVKAQTHILHNGEDQATSNAEHIVVHCVEASHSSFSRLLRIRETLPDAHASAQWRVHNIAMTKESGEVMFTTDCGTELCHIEVSGEGRKVRAYSVDDFVRNEGIQDIAILKIDTEGFDPDVINGAMVTLEQGKADIVTFEYHGIGLWLETSLESVVASLEVSGYACYFDGSPTLTRLDAQCWHADYEFKTWSNVVCARKSFKELHTAFERLSFRAAHFMHRAAL